MASNADIEMCWVDAWSEVHDIVGSRQNVPCLLPDGSIVSVEECLAWLQRKAYQGFMVSIEEGWVGHRRGMLAHGAVDVESQGSKIP